jgi:hypothetical protein
MSSVGRQWTTPTSWQLSQVTIFAAKGDALSIIFGIRKHQEAVAERNGDALSAEAWGDIADTATEILLHSN